MCICMYHQTPRSAQDIFAGGLEMFWDVVPESHVLSCLTREDVAQLRVVAHFMASGFSQCDRGKVSFCKVIHPMINVNSSEG